MSASQALKLKKRFKNNNINTFLGPHICLFGIILRLLFGLLAKPLLLALVRTGW